MIAAPVLIAEPHEVCRRVMANAIASADRLRVVGASGATAEAVELARLTCPAVILVAVEGADGCQLVRKLRERTPDARVVVLAMADDPEIALEAVRAGACGFLPKSANPDEIVSTLSRVADGEIVFHPAVAASALVAAVDRVRTDQSRREMVRSLTAREREILEYLADGVSQKTMASRLHLSRRTIESHLSRVYRKLGVHGQIEAIRTFRRFGEA